MQKTYVLSERLVKTIVVYPDHIRHRLDVNTNDTQLERGPSEAVDHSWFRTQIQHWAQRLKNVLHRVKAAHLLYLPLR